MIQVLEYSEGESQFRYPSRIRVLVPDLKPRNLPAEAPQSVASLFCEASMCENAGAYRGAAALYRATVEELVADLGSTAGTLEVRLDALSQRNVDPDLVADLHEARLLGNWSLHEGVEFSKEEVADVAALITDAIHQLYVQPAQREAMKKARASRRAAMKSQSDTPDTGT
jgi:hypothetical protein